MTPARGEVWRYRPVSDRAGLSPARLVVSAAAINGAERLPVVLALQVLLTDPGGLLAVELPGRPGPGEPAGAGAPLERGSRRWVSALTVEPVLRDRLVERVDVVDAATMQRVDQALRAAQEL